MCGRKVVVSAAAKKQLDSKSGAVILCEQCAGIQAQEWEIEALRESKPDVIEDVEHCTTCAALKEQEQSAAMELARCKNLLAG